MAVEKLKFTKRRLEALPIPQEGRTYYRDTDNVYLYFGIHQTGRRVFQAVKKFQGKTKRITLGTFPELMPTEARMKASKAILQMDAGIDPVQEKRALISKGITLAECLGDYLKDKPDLAVKTVTDYQRSILIHLSKWADKPMSEITRSMCDSKHKKLSKTQPVLANNVMRHLRAVFNFANSNCEDEKGNSLFPENPVSKVKFNTETRRQGHVAESDLSKWVAAVNSLPEHSKHGEAYRDYFLLVLFTGLRRKEASSLEWSNVHFNDKTFKVPNTKNRKTHTLPMSGFVYDLLKARHNSKKGRYVFTTVSDKKPLSEIKSMITKIEKLSGLYVTAHDLRRTFITTAERLRLSRFEIKRMVNHSLGKDVTEGYMIWTVEYLREPMQKIADHFMKAAEITPNDNVIKLAAMQTKKK